MYKFYIHNLNITNIENSKIVGPYQKKIVGQGYYEYYFKKIIILINCFIIVSLMYIYKYLVRPKKGLNFSLNVSF